MIALVRLAGDGAVLQQNHDEEQNGAVLMRMILAALALAAFVVAALSVAAHSLSPAIEPQPPTSAQHTVPSPEARVDINHASVDELMKVPGMTPAWAGRIVRFRPYRTKQDLVEQGVLTGQVYNRIKDYVIAHRDKQ